MCVSPDGQDGRFPAGCIGSCMIIMHSTACARRATGQKVEGTNGFLWSQPSTCGEHAFIMLAHVECGQSFPMMRLMCWMDANCLAFCCEHS